MRSRCTTRQRRLDAEAMHRRAAGIASSRASAIGRPHDSHSPYVPCSILPSAASMSCRFSRSVPARACTSPRSAVTWPESAKPSSKSRSTPRSSNCPVTRSCSAWSWARRVAEVVSAMPRMLLRGAPPTAGEPGRSSPALACSARHPSSRMGGLVYRTQSRGCDLCVHLRRRDARVAEQLLDDPQIGTVVEHVGRTGVSQYVRGKSLTEGNPFAGSADDLPTRLTRDPPPTCVEHHGIRVAGPARARAAQREPSVAEVRNQGALRLAPEGNDTLLVALAHDAHHSVFEVELGEIETDRLADADARAVQQFQERAIALREWLVPRDRGEQLLDIGLVERLGNALRNARRADVLARI